MKLFRKTVIAADSQEGPLLVRYILFRCAAFGFYLHHLVRSDHDRALHDHPWPFVSIVLRGGYTEIHDQTLDGASTTLWHRPGSVLVRPAEWRHRFALTKPAWTLVIVGRRSRRWGFFVPQASPAHSPRTKWCWWRQYNPNLGICEDRVLYTQGKD